VIHPTAIIHSKAKLDSSVEVGPYAVIDQAVEIGAECIIGPHVYLTGRTTIGARNHFFAGCVIGEAPQDLKYRNEPTGVRIGEDNVFREHVTVHRSSKVAEQTIIGSQNFLMQHSHVAHNVVLGDHVILAGGALLAGYARVDDRAFISGNCLVHQFVRVGTLALMQGGSAVSKDLPPFTVAHEANILCGLNNVGMRRAGMSAAERQELKQLYRVLFREGKNLRDAVGAARKKFSSEPAKTMLDFIASSKRGICFDSGSRGESASDEESE
jgi:UDP-N-acetylglucosamine acyltransferase